MRLLSLWQPWASFVALGYKKNETRSWATPYRGLLAIHAAKNTKALKDADEILEDAGFDMSERTTVGGTQWPLGKILCVAELVDCVPTKEIRESLSVCERAMGNYEDGRFAWILKNVEKLSPYIPYRGTQGLRSIASGVLMTGNKVGKPDDSQEPKG